MVDYYCEECEVTIVRDGKSRHIGTSKHKKNLEKNKRNRSVFLNAKNEEIVTTEEETVKKLISEGINVEITYSVKKDGDKVVKFKF